MESSPRAMLFPNKYPWFYNVKKPLSSITLMSKGKRGDYGQEEVR